MNKAHKKRWAWMKRLRERPLQSWRLGILKIQDPVVRCRVANIVWWDIFGSFKFADHEQHTHLDDLRSEHAEPWKADNDKVIDELCTLGFSRWWAKKRMKPVDENFGMRGKR